MRLSKPLLCFGYALAVGLTLYLLAAAVALAPLYLPEPRPPTRLTPAGGALLSNRRLPGEEEFSSFADLVFWHGRWYACCRTSAESDYRVGAICIYRSDDFEKWRRVARLEIPGVDCRYPHFVESATGELLLNAASVTALDDAPRYQSVLFRSANGERWDGPAKIGEANVLLWRLRRHGRALFGVGYATAGFPTQFIRLYRSDDDGRTWKAVADPVTGNYTTEAELFFDADETLRLLVRRDRGQRSPPAAALLVFAPPPYTKWVGKELGVQFASPSVTRLEDGRILVAGRFCQPNRMSLAWLDLKKGQLTEFLTLAEAADCGYPGVVVRDGIAYVVYHTEGEDGGTHLYAARVRLPNP